MFAIPMLYVTVMQSTKLREYSCFWVLHR